MAKTSKLGSTAASADDVISLINQSIAELSKAIKAQGLKFFPNGIELIEISVSVVNIEMAFKVAGPNASKLVSDGGLEAAPTR